MKELYVFGTGGHAKMVIDILELNNHKITAVVDRIVQENPLTESEFQGIPLIEEEKFFSTNHGKKISGIIAVGDNWARFKLVQKIKNFIPGFNYVSAVHPTAIISKKSNIGEGVVIMAGVIIGPNSAIKNHTIIGTQSSIDQECQIDDYGQISQGCTLGRKVHIGFCTTISLGVKIIEEIEVGEYSEVGAGSVVLKDVPGRSLANGIPAKVVSLREPHNDN